MIAVKETSPYMERTPIRFEIEGLRETGIGVFELLIEDYRYIDYGDVREHLVTQKVDERILEEAIEQMANFIATRTLALTLASRMKVVG